MKSLPLLAALGLSLRCAGIAFGHDLAGGGDHPHYDWSVKPPGADGEPVWFLAQADSGRTRNRVPDAGATARSNRPVQAAAFEMFAPRVSVRWDERFLFVESNGMPAHDMMVGITAWQQQVPLPQNYTGANAWQIPLAPVPAKTPASIKGRFLRGAIALAANGIPIFNPQNNRGEVSQEIGELDQWGGHCGRADDYHYHAAPLHLQSVVGKDQPIAYALDGYAIYGLTEPDGSTPAGLDEFHGHTTAAMGYHYHASTKYPYVNGGFHGEVVEAGGQVDPQPHAQPVRRDQPPLRGAKITGFETTGNSYKLTYEVAGEKRAILYSINADGSVPFEFQNGSAATTKETYTRRESGGRGQGGPRPDGERPPRPEGGSGGPRPRDGRGGPQADTNKSVVPSTAVDSLQKPDGLFVLTSPEVSDSGNLPADYTGDGSGATLPLSWRGAPVGTKSYALVMDHLAPGNVMKSYWNIWDIPATVTSLPKNVKGVGKVGTSFKGQLGYEPPHSQGPGAKTYVLTLYALSAPVQFAQPPGEVTREVLLAEMKGKVLASSSLHVVYTRASTASNGETSPQAPLRNREAGDPARGEASGQRPPPRSEDQPGADGRPHPSRQVAAADQAPPQADGQRPGGPGGKGKGGADNKGLIKPTLADTIKVNVYADNWFVLFINGELVAVDSIKFTPHNVVSVDILPEYPMTIAIMAKDNADLKTGLEYGNHIGDGGFIIKFADGTVSNATWKAKNFFKGPLDHDATNPKVEHTPIPDHWWSVDFDDSAWPHATEYTEERVNPKQPFYEADFVGAKFIWSEDLDLDNTIIFRTRVEKPAWTKRWNTKPDIDITGAPFK